MIRGLRILVDLRGAAGGVGALLVSWFTEVVNRSRPLDETRTGGDSSFLPGSLETLAGVDSTENRGL